MAGKRSPERGDPVRRGGQRLVEPLLQAVARARQGHQVHLVDLLIAVTALRNGDSVLTRDREFSIMSRALAIDVEVF